MPPIKLSFASSQGPSGPAGPTGPAGPAPSGTGWVSVLDGVVQTPRALLASDIPSLSSLYDALGAASAAQTAAETYAAAQAFAAQAAAISASEAWASNPANLPALSAMTGAITTGQLPGVSALESYLSLGSAAYQPTSAFDAAGAASAAQAAAISAAETYSSNASNLSAGTIPNARISALPLANLATLAAATLLGNNGGSSAVPAALSVAQVQAMLALPTLASTGPGYLSQQSAGSAATVRTMAQVLSDIGAAPAAGSSAITTVGTLAAGSVPASLVTAGTFGAGNYSLSNTSVFTAGPEIDFTGSTTVTPTNPQILRTSGGMQFNVPSGGGFTFSTNNTVSSATVNMGALQLSANGTINAPTSISLQIAGITEVSLNSAAFQLTTMPLQFGGTGVTGIGANTQLFLDASGNLNENVASGKSIKRSANGVVLETLNAASGLTLTVPITGTNAIFAVGPTNATSTLVTLNETPTWSTNATNYVIGVSCQANTVVNTGVTQSGYVETFQSYAMRNYTRGATTDDGGTLNSMAGWGSNIGHFNTNPLSAPQTTTVYGIDISPYIESGTITNLYGLYLGGLNKVPSTVWAASTAYAANATVSATSGSTGLLFVCTTAGASGSGSQPSWNQTIGGTTSDGTVTWTTIALPSITNEYGIYSGSATAKNYFAGPVALGSSPVTFTGIPASSPSSINYVGVTSSNCLAINGVGNGVVLAANGSSLLTATSSGITAAVPVNSSAFLPTSGYTVVAATPSISLSGTNVIYNTASGGEHYFYGNGTSVGTCVMHLLSTAIVQGFGSTTSLQIQNATSSGSDNQSIGICGGGGYSPTRGGCVAVYGVNTTASPGLALLQGGQVSILTTATANLDAVTSTNLAIYELNDGTNIVQLVVVGSTSAVTISALVGSATSYAATSTPTTSQVGLYVSGGSLVAKNGKVTTVSFATTCTSKF